MATGSGQAALGLNPYFRQIIASDASCQQIANAQESTEISYFIARAEALPVRAECADLITVAQAMHWFDQEGFSQEVKHALKPGGILAAWSYDLLTITPEIDAILHDWERDIIGPYWPPERALVGRAYDHLPFPFARIETPAFEMTCNWSLAELTGYLNTWSGVKRYQKQHQRNPVNELESEIRKLWGNELQPRIIQWPLILLTGRK
jgi:SAM-dependent methyltransferase